MDADLRDAVTALVRLVAGAEEGALLGQLPVERESQGSPDAWSLSALVAHNTEFKAQQVARLKAARDRLVPPSFGEVDHASADVYRGFASADWGEVLDASRVVTAGLLDLFWELPQVDLTDPARNPWLRGRPLWLQVVVRGFWHPGGHLGEYWLVHGHPERTLYLHRAGVGLAEVMGVPAPAVGMARYALACACARNGEPQSALEEVARAISANPDLAQNAGRDPDLQPVRSLPGWKSLRQ